MKVRVTTYKAIFLDKATSMVFEKEGCYTGTMLKTDLSQWAKENDLKLLAVSGRGKAMTEFEAPLFIETPGRSDEGKEVQSND